MAKRVQVVVTRKGARNGLREGQSQLMSHDEAKALVLLGHRAYQTAAVAAKDETVTAPARKRGYQRRDMQAELSGAAATPPRGVLTTETSSWTDPDNGETL